MKTFLTFKNKKVEQNYQIISYYFLLYLALSVYLLYYFGQFGQNEHIKKRRQYH